VKIRLSFIKKPSLLILILLVAGYGLTGCGKSDKQTAFVRQTIKKFDKPTMLYGQVNGKDRPMKTGTINVTNSNGLLLVSEIIPQSRKVY